MCFHRDMNTIDRTRGAIWISISQNVCFLSDGASSARVRCVWRAADLLKDFFDITRSRTNAPISNK